ncbi:MAG: hypothetical protein GY832_08300, partial [Chloroflexi bacterium]|nr:hypothetical protein [Chloroflexota bacterium]
MQFIQEHKWALMIGAVLGLALGLLIGYGVWPVEWINASPARLRSDYMGNYLLWVAEQYESNGDQAWVRKEMGMEHWKEGDLAKVLAALDAVEARAGGGAETVHLRALKTVLESTPPDTEAPADPVAEDGEGGLLGSVVGTCGVALLVLAVVIAIVILVSRIMARRAGDDAGPGVRGDGPIAPPADVDWGIEGPPLVQFVTNYALGDDHYDPSFSIELENGEFMGECGVGVSESIGVGAPNKVTAFEVWLFDKSDIRTVTKVLLSDYAFSEDALKAKLAPKGEPVLAKLGN